MRLDELRSGLDELAGPAKRSTAAGLGTVHRVARRRRAVRAGLAISVIVLVLGVASVLLLRSDGGGHVTPAQRGLHETVPVGTTSSLGPFTLNVTKAVSTVQPHTYVLTVSLTNRRASASLLPIVRLNCEGGGPRSFGVTGFLLTDHAVKVAPHTTKRGDVTFSRHRRVRNLPLPSRR